MKQVNKLMNEINYKSKLEDFVADLNLLLRDYFLFPDQNNGEFILHINTCKFDSGNDGCVIYLWFKWRGHNPHVIYHRVNSGFNLDVNEVCKLAYLEIFRNAFLAIDMVNCMKGENGNVINVLSFQTLFTSGLKKIYETESK